MIALGTYRSSLDEWSEDVSRLDHEESLALVTIFVTNVVTQKR